MTIAAIALSGGVDSAVAAHLLLEAGHKVLGVTLDLGQDRDQTGPGDPAITGKTLSDARRVAAQLGIPHYVFDLREVFSTEVKAYFIDAYLQGRTPNPCVVCNQRIKFGPLIQEAQKLGADFLATGHYARIRAGENGRRLLYRGQDRQKDQSYFLYGLTQEQLGFACFPLGNYPKKKVRCLAKGLNLAVAAKAESQEICFIPKDDYRSFLRAQAPNRVLPGLFLDLNGKVLGRHRGIAYYTIGQRKGLGLALGRPVYVLRIDPKENAVVIGEEKDLYQQQVWAEKNNFIPFPALTQALKVEAKIRYAATPAKAIIYPAEGEQVRIEFSAPQRAVAPGQAIVYYQGDLVVGGGIILRTES